MYKVLVLLATHNGLAYLTRQYISIVNQKNISIHLHISDDASNDGTFQYLEKLQVEDIRITLLPSTYILGSAGRNFYRLIIDSDFMGYDYVAFSDQDDIWMPEKLSHHIELIKRYEADGVSSNVTAFWPDGKEKLVNKAQPQRQYDYLFESAGPGCTFLMTKNLVSQVKELLINYPDIAQQVALHDWLTYSVCRSSGKKWVIDSVPSVMYRQHSHNVIGANSGAKAYLSRLKKMTNGWYRQEVIKLTQISMMLSPDPKLKELYEALNTSGLRGRLTLLKYAGEARRSLRERIFLAGSILLGIF